MTAVPEQVTRPFERLTGESIHATTPAGIQQLVDNQVPEGDQLDYKVDAYDGTAGKIDKKDELRKDVTALANGRGGVLVLGVADSKGLPGKVVGLTQPLEQVDGWIRKVLASNVEPYLAVDTVRVEGSLSEPKCMLVIVPRSPRRPHAVRPVDDPTALKYARRGGAHTEWLSESQVADAYRDRFAAARSQVDRVEQVMASAKSVLSKRAWFVLALTPEMEGDLVISRSATETVEAWLLGRDPLDLIPDRIGIWPDAAAIGPGQVIVAGTDATTVPSRYFVTIHSDGSSAVALELKGPGGNPSTYLDRLVGDILEALEIAGGLAVDVARAGGTATVRAELHAAESPTFLCWDASWSKNPTELPGSPTSVVATATVDLDAMRASPRDLIAATALLAARMAHHFGEPDGRYLTHDGIVRVNQFNARDREKHVLPITRAQGLEVTEAM